jgi:LysM repeat protein
MSKNTPAIAKAVPDNIQSLPTRKETHAKDYEHPVLIDLPKLGNNIKKVFAPISKFTKKHYKAISFSMMALGLLIIVYAAIINVTNDKPIAQDKPATTDKTEVVVSDTPTPKTPAQDTPATPPAPAPAEPEETASATASAEPIPVEYTVQDGDTLWELAVVVYGDGNQWTRIWELNKDTLIAQDARNLESPGHWIQAGQTIKVDT